MNRVHAEVVKSIKNVAESNNVISFRSCKESSEFEKKSAINAGFSSFISRVNILETII